MRNVLVLTLAVAMTCISGFAKGGAPRSHSRHTTTASSGTGSKSSSTTVHTYTRRNGKRVDSYHRTTPDRTQKNNFSTKGNVNPYTGKAGTKSATK